MSSSACLPMPPCSAFLGPSTITVLFEGNSSDGVDQDSWRLNELVECPFPFYGTYHDFSGFSQWSSHGKDLLINPIWLSLKRVEFPLGLHLRPPLPVGRFRKRHPRAKKHGNTLIGGSSFLGLVILRGPTNNAGFPLVSL